MGCQWLGVTLFLAAFIIAFVHFPSPVIGAEVGQAHKALGITVMALLGVQVGTGPTPTHTPWLLRSLNCKPAGGPWHWLPTLTLNPKPRDLNHG